jgi:hypothetical protein
VGVKPFAADLNSLLDRFLVVVHFFLSLSETGD